jgi:hypothetical protein
VAKKWKEALSKNYETWYDEKHEVLYLKTFHTMTEEDVREAMALSETKYKGIDIQYALVDMSEATAEPISKGARKAFKEHTGIMNYKKVAVVGANPAVRMLAKVALAVIGKSKVTRFFKTEAEALAWLKGKK